jgi:MerR family transcriptional regulator/heat shock protein HspR
MTRHGRTGSEDAGPGATGAASTRPPGATPGDAGPHDTRALYVISVAAELAGVHPQTLRIYERRGLLDPSRTRGGSRRFSEQDLAKLRHIQSMTNEGLNLQGVRRVLELEGEVARLRRDLEVARAEAREAVERTHRQYRRDLVPVSQAPVPFVALRRSARDQGRFPTVGQDPPRGTPTRQGR